MKKKIVCALLCLGLCLPSAFAAGNVFSDVKDTDWFAPYVSICAENGLMNGTGEGKFSPNSLLTEAECSTLALRLFMIPRGGDGAFETAPEDWQGPDQWWRDAAYTAQLWEAEGLTFSSRSADRNFFVQTLALTTEGLGAINSITFLPDTSDKAILAFYNAGILTGVDSYGTFAGDRTLTRSEAAAMIARILEPSLRQSFIPQAMPTQSVPTTQPSPSTGVGTGIVTVNGHPISLETFQTLICNIAYESDYVMYINTNQRLDWNQTYGGEYPAQSILNYAKEMAVYRGLLELQAQALGCSEDEVAARLTPSPSIEALRAYAQTYDILCAKHILCPDSQTAQAVLDGLEAVPTLEQFNALLQVFNTDPGMVQNPNGYLFTTGDMISEFEVAVRGLETHTYTTKPVESQFGFHIIWRMDPAEHPELVNEYQQVVLDELLTSQAAQAQVTMDEAAIAAIDVPALYNAFLKSLSAQQ